MPTLDGKLWKSDVTGFTGSFRVTPSGLTAGDGSAMVGLPIVIACGVDDDAGLYNQVILPGDYIVQIPGVRQFTIQIPTGSGTYSLEDVVDDSDNPLTFQRVYDNWAAVQAVTISSSISIITLREDASNPVVRDVSFFADSSAEVQAFTPDGVNVIDDAGDNRFLRQGINPADL